MMTTPAAPTAAAPKRALRGVDDDRLVTGEGVLIDVPATSVGSLILAALIDAVGVALVLVVFSFISAAFASNISAAQVSILSLVLGVLLTLVIPVTVETLTRGRSLGKIILKLRVVRDDGGPITFRHAFVRGLVGVIEIWTLYGIPAIISAMVSTRAKRLGDFAAGTYVVREETSMKLAPGPVMPPALALWASTADMVAMPDGLALQIRQFLMRATTLTPAAHDQVGRALLAQVLPLVSPAPPPQAPLDSVLAAVLAERRRREERRLTREAQLRQRLLPDPRVIR